MLTVLLAMLLTQAQPLTLSIKDAVDRALHNYPSIAVSQELINSAAAGIELARTAYVPKVDLLGQVNGATRNNVFGLLLPQSVVPPISGPVGTTNNYGLVFSNAAGALLTWEPFDLGQRQAGVDAATAVKAR